MRFRKTNFAVLLCILSMAILCFGFAACGGTKDTQKYKVSLNYNSEQGNVALAPAAADNLYEDGSKVTVSVTAKSGYEIENFTVSTDTSAKLTDGKYELTVSADATVTATFKETSDEPPVKNYYTVTTNYDSEQGTVTLSPAPTDGKYEEGTEVTVAVKASEGYELDAFSVSTDSSAALDDEGQYLLTVSADTTISATFKAVEVAVESVTLNKEELTVHITKEDSSLVAAVLPENATTKTVTWKSEAEDVVSVDANGKITAVGAGSAKITATVGDKSATCTVTVTDHELENKPDGATGHHVECSVEGCGYKSETTAHVKDDDPYSDGASGHHYECATCGYTMSTEAHVNPDPDRKWTPNGMTDHYYVCSECSETVRGKHQLVKDYTPDDGEHTKCNDCGLDMIPTKHNLAASSNDGKGNHTLKCQNAQCTYTKTVACEMEWTPLANKSEGHSGACKTEGCGYKVESEPHDKNGEDGSCSKCGYKDFGEHVHEDKPDANGFYDGLCDEDGENMTWEYSVGKITKYTGSYDKVIVPSAIKGIAITELDKSLFASQADLTDLIVPDSVTKIGATLFNKSTALKSVVFGMGITSLATATFQDCTQLRSVVLKAATFSFSSSCFGGKNKVPTGMRIFFNMSASALRSDIDSISSTTLKQYAETYIKQYYCYSQNNPSADESLQQFGGAWHYDDSGEQIGDVKIAIWNQTTGSRIDGTKYFIKKLKGEVYYEDEI